MTIEEQVKYYTGISDIKITEKDKEELSKFINNIVENNNNKNMDDLIDLVRLELYRYFQYKFVIK